jgi:hypothetical protein
MISCPNKSTKEWKSLSSELGEEKAMLAYIRNGDTIPEVGKARELITNRGMLESLQILPTLSKSGIIDTLRTSRLIHGEAIMADGKTYYQLNPNMDNIADELGKLTDKFGAVLEYKSDYVSVNEESIDVWNNVASMQEVQNKSLTELSKNFLDRIGVGISQQDDVLKLYGSNGIADFAERMVRIQSGMMDQALPEEALHFFLDMMEQDNPALMEALDKIRNTATYKATLEKYKNNPNYRTAEGQVRFDKIRKEALAKELASQMKAEKPKSSWFERVIEAIMNWIKGTKVQKTPHEILSEMFYAPDIARLNTNLPSSEMYNQLSDEQKTFYEAQNMNEDQRNTLNQIVSYVAATGFDPATHTYQHAGVLATDMIKSVTKILGSDFYTDLDNEDIIAEILLNFEDEYSSIIDPFEEDSTKSKKIIDHILTQLITGEMTKEQLAEAFGGEQMDALNKKINELLVKASEAKTKTLFGTAIHSIVEDIILGKDFDLDELMASDKIENIALRTLIDRKTLDKIVNGTAYEKGIKDVIRDIRADGSLIMTEVEISNGSLGGIIDILAIKPDGIAEIYDFKTKFAQNVDPKKSYIKKVLLDEFNSAIKSLSPYGVKDEPNTLERLKNKQRSHLQKYSQQLSIYKKLLMEAGIKVGSLNVIGVPYRLDETTRKVSTIQTALVKDIPYDPKIAKEYFSTLDESMNASGEKEIVLEKDERIKTLEELDKNKLKESFVKALARLTEISNRFNSRGDVEEIYKLLNNEASKTNKLDIQRSNVITALNNFDDVLDFANIQMNFLEMVDSSVPIIKIATEYFDKLKKDTPTDREGASQRLNELMKTKDFLMGYKNMFDDLLKYMGDIDHTNPLIEKLTGLSGTIEKIRANYIDVISPVISKMMEGLFDENSLGTIKREFNELIAAANTRGNVKRAEMLKKERDSLPSEKVINELMKGDRGDANWLFSRLVSTISNPDIILAGVAKKLKGTLDRVRLENKKWRDSLGTEFDKRAAIYGRGMNIKNINESLVTLVEEFNPYAKDEKNRTMHVLHFKSEFEERLYSVHAQHIFAIIEAEKTGDKDAIREAKKAKKDFEQQYMQTGYTNAYYEMTKPMDTKVMYQGKQMSIREVEGDIRDQIKQLEVQYSDDDKLNGGFNPEYLKELQRLNDIKSELREKFDDRGNPKTGDALKIAEILEEYDKNKKNLFDFEVQTEYFNRAQEKAKLQYGEGTKEFQKWMANNTRLVIKDEFYKKRQDLFEEQATILGTLQSKEVSDLYKELSTLTKLYRDKDGNIKGSMIPEDAATKIKEIQDKISVLQQDMDIDFTSGNTKEERDEKNLIMTAKKAGLPFSKRRLNEIRVAGEERLAERMADDPFLPEKLDRLKEIKTELFAMGKTENSKYYDQELEKREEMFAESLGISYSELFKENPATGESYYKLFKESKWYQDNHITKGRVLYENEETGETREVSTDIPTYQWRRFMPIADYIEQQPANHFTKVVDKESYINDKGEKVILKVSDNLDIKRRFKPKSNEDYRKEYGMDHPYLDQDFAALKTKYKNGTASAQEKVDYENLLFIHSKMIAAQERIPYNQRLGLAVPFKEKHFFERTVESGGKNIQNKGASIVEGIKRAIGKTDQDVDQNGIPTGQEDISNDISKLATMDNNQIRHIPVRFSTKGDAKNASYDVWGGVLDYVGAINRKSELEKDLAFINGLEEILGDKDNQPKSEDRNMILNNIYQKYIPELSAKINKGGNIRLETLKSFINSVMYNEESFKGFEMFGVNTQKAINQVMSLSSYAMLGVAPISWTVNWLSGNVQNIVESVGGRDYTFKDFTAAHADIYTGGKYGCAIKDMQSDYIKGKVGNLSFWGQIMEIFDPLQGEFENEFGHKTHFNTAKNIFSTGIYAGKIWGEWEIQMKTFIAYMKNQRLYNGKVFSKEDFITHKIGSEVENRTLQEISALKLTALEEWDKLDVNLLDMMEMGKDGIVGMKDQYKGIFELGSQEFSHVVAKLHAMQKKLNGSYNKFDSAYAEKTSLGKMMFFFRKYFITIGMNRWGTMRSNYESMNVEQGFYLTFLQTIGKDLKDLKFNIAKNWHTYSDFEKRAIKKTMADVAIVLGIMLMYSLLFGYDPDDPDRMRKLREKGWAAQTAVFLLLRTRSETKQFLPPSGIEEIKGIYSNPSLVFGQITQYINMSKMASEHLLNVIPGVDFNSSLYYQKQSSDATLLGMTLKDEGDSKLFAQVMKTFGGYTGKTFNPIEAIKGWEFMQDQRTR